MNFMNYIQKFGVYNIGNINNDQLLAVIKNWMNKVNNNDKMIYLK